MKNKNNIEFYDVVNGISGAYGYYAVKDVVPLGHTENICRVKRLPKRMSRGVIDLINNDDSFLSELLKAYEDFKKDDLGDSIGYYQTSCGEVQIKKSYHVISAYLSSEK